MKIFLHASRHHFDTLDCGKAIIDHIIALSEGEPIAVSERCYEHLRRFLPQNAYPLKPFEPIKAELALSLGGDGTFLRTAQWAAPFDVPILGVNAGHLGYLADFTPETFLGSQLDDVVIEPRMMLKVECSAQLPDDFIPYAVNEVALLRRDTASMISVHARLNSHELTTYRGDGLIVSTPTGSTGYNLSVGGPIIEPTAPVMVISPVAPHALTMRPLVVDASSKIYMTADSRADGCLLSLDSRVLPVPIDSRVAVSRTDFPLKVVHRHDYGFVSTLRSKLLWGQS